MSRGVSRPSGCAWTVYLYPSRVNEDEYDFGQMEEDWKDFIECIRYVFKQAYPSLDSVDTWLDREDRAILANAHCHIGISEYNGVVALWCVPKEDDGYYESRDGLHEQWCASINNNVVKLVMKTWPGQVLVNRGHASNGEQFFALAEQPGSCVTTKEGRLF